MHLEPTDDGARRLLQRGINGPLLMLNLLRFREEADYSAFPELAPSQPISGRDAYDRYVHHTIPFLEKSGGSISLFATGGHYFVGPADERWDLAMLIRQASLADFFAFASNTAYLAGIAIAPQHSKTRGFFHSSTSRSRSRADDPFTGPVVTRYRNRAGG